MARRRISHVETHGRASKHEQNRGDKLFAEQRRTDVRLYMKTL